MTAMRIARYQVVPLVLLALVAGLAVIVAVWLITTSRQPSGTVEYFPQTRHNVQREFLAFFRENGGLEVFGFPMTEEIIVEGRRVQYFQKALMQLNGSGDEARIELRKVAVEMGLDTEPIPDSQLPPNDDPTRRYFPETGHTVGLPFLLYFDERGGADFFGYPISEAAELNGRTVQYFERARMDLYPDRPPGERVQLGELGESHFVFARLDPDLRRGVSAIPELATDTPSAPVARPAELRVEASVNDPYASKQQTLHVLVMDENDGIVQGAEVAFEVEYPNEQKRYGMPATNERGSTSLSFLLDSVPAGFKLTIRVTATLDGLSKSMTVSSIPRQ
jgi:hypothetical protein